jgi:hypothetical protein
MTDTISATLAASQDNLQTGHTLSVRFRDNRVWLNLVCHEPDSAVCHLACSDCDDTSMGHNPKHTLTSTEECNAALWIGNNAEEYCEWRSSFKLSDGMSVTIEWDSDTYVWYPEQTGGQ